MNGAGGGGFFSWKRWSNLAKIPARPRPPVGTTPADVVLSENKWRLLRYRARAAGPAWKTPLLLVPSLINRHYVLDLLPGKSFAEYLVAAGHDVFVIDWGTPTDEDRFVTFDDVVDGYIGRAIRRTAREAGADRAHVLGYCMGGTLAAVHLAAHQEHVASFVALAAPVAFDDDGLLAKWTRSATFDVGTMVSALGNVPWQLMQSAFHMLRPTLTLSKTVHLVDRAYDDEFLDGFLALETWGNDNVSLPGAFYERYIDDLYRGDALARGTMTLRGAEAKLEAIRCPTLTVTFEHDNIVPWKSAKLLHDRIASADKEWLHLSGGHVGAVVSRSAAKGLWPKLAKFWAERDALGLDALPAPTTAPATSGAKRNGAGHKNGAAPVKRRAAAATKSKRATSASPRTRSRAPR